MEVDLMETTDRVEIRSAPEDRFDDWQFTATDQFTLTDAMGVVERHFPELVTGDKWSGRPCALLVQHRFYKRKELTEAVKCDGNSGLLIAQCQLEAGGREFDAGVAVRQIRTLSRSINCDGWKLATLTGYLTEPGSVQWIAEVQIIPSDDERFSNKDVLYFDLFEWSLFGCP